MAHNCPKCRYSSCKRECGCHCRAEVRRYMMATLAFHALGSVSRRPEDLCFVTWDDGADYIGNWVTGYGFIHVRFPKETTRELTAEERARFNGKRLEINGTPAGEVRC